MRVLLSPWFLCDQKEGRLTMQYCPLGRSLMAAEGETFKITRKRSARSLTLVLTGDSRASKLRGGNFISQITSFLHYQHDIEQSETESCSCCCCCSKQSSLWKAKTCCTNFSLIAGSSNFNLKLLLDCRCVPWVKKPLPLTYPLNCRAFLPCFKQDGQRSFAK